MIYGKIIRIDQVIGLSTYERIKGFLDFVNENTPDGEYEIFKKEIVAKVMTYETVVPHEGIIEAHNKYIDIQFTLKGAEGISIFDRDRLIVSKEYDEIRDVILFEENAEMLMAYTNNLPGFFTMLFPEDAHRPGDKIRGIEEVKKVVIKVKVNMQYA